MEFRDKAREALSRARVEVGSSDPARLKYAALEIRLAIEMLAYDKLKSLTKQVGREAFEKWQANKVLEFVEDISPSSAVTGEVVIASGEGKKLLEGRHDPLTISDVKKDYHALGAALHAPTLSRINIAEHDQQQKLLHRCERMIARIKKSLDAPIFNFNFGNEISFDCTRKECDGKIFSYYLPPDQNKKCSCLKCGAGYVVEFDDDGWRYRPDMFYANCPKGECTGKLAFWRFRLDRGETATCSKCDMEFVLALCAIRADMLERSGGKFSDLKTTIPGIHFEFDDE